MAEIPVTLYLISGDCSRLTAHARPPHRVPATYGKLSKCFRCVKIVKFPTCTVSTSLGDITTKHPACQKALMPLASCLPFITVFGGVSSAGRPTEQCCNAVRPPLENDFRCVCLLFRFLMSPHNFKVTFNLTAALEIPWLCNRTIDVTKCKGVLKLPPNSKEARTFRQYGNMTARLTTAPTSSNAVTCAIFITFVLVGILLYKKHRMDMVAKMKVIKEREHIISANTGGRYHNLFHGKDMKKATNSFSKDRLLGSGGFGDVYKGILEDGSIVAMKIGKGDSIKSTEQLLNEVSILSQVNHRSLVKLLGCCVELNRPLLVYEFISNGTLHDHIHSGKYGFLNWAQRLRIAHQSAQGIAYLHSSAVQPIYHRDIKSSNILLDERCNAKVSDFGLSRLVEPDRTHVTTLAQGTMGYLDPEYCRTYQPTDKSDVYSFGVVLLELVTSKKVMDSERGETDRNLVVYVENRVDESKINEILDEKLCSGESEGCLEAMASLCSLAMRCLEEKTQDRPSMEKVVEEIEYIMTTCSEKPSTVAASEKV